MGLGKTYSADYLADSNNNTGVAGQVLISTATGINWSDGTDIIGGPYLPLSGGTLTGTLVGTIGDFAGLGYFGEMTTITITDISTGENRGLKLLNTSGVDQQWNITAGQTGVDNDKFTIRDSTNDVDALTIGINGGSAAFAGGGTFAGTIDATGRVKVSGGDTDQYFYEGARTGVGVTLRLYDNANNIYLDGWAGIALRANQIGGSGGNITLSGGTGGATIIMPNLGSTLSDQVTGLMLQGVRHDIIFKQIRTAAATDWNNTTQRIQARVDTTLMQSIDFVTDASYNRHIDINTASNAFNSRFTHNGRLGVGVDNPSQRLEVNGNIYATGYTQAGNTLIGLKSTGTGAGVINFAALGSNSSATGVAIGRDFNPGTYPDLMISSAGDVGLGVITALAKFHVVGGNMLATDGLARLSLGAQGSTGDVHFGSSGMGSPPTGFLQDYGFYSAHNAYRTSTGAWKHSRTSTIGAAMFSGGGGGGNTGTTGFTWNYSANNGTSDITWTRLMEMTTSGALQLNAYGAGVLESDASGNITSTGNSWNGPYLPLSAGVSNELTGILKLASSTTTGANHIVMGEGSSRYINYRITDTPDNTGTIYIILCAYLGGNDVNGTIKMDRTSGLRFATSIDVLVSAGSTALPVGGLRSMSTAGTGEPNCELVKVTYDPGTGTASEHIAVKVTNPDNYYESTGVYFTGRSSVIGVMKPVAPSEVSSITSFEANTRFNTQGTSYFDGNVGIGTDSPSELLELKPGSGGDAKISMLKSDGSQKALIGYDDANGGLINLSNEAGTTNVVVRGYGDSYFNGGNFGIGTTSPGADKLVVNGTINFNSSGDKGFVCNPAGGTFSLGDIDDVAGGAYINGDGTYINYYAGGVITGRLEDDGTLTVTGDMVAYGSPSDKRLKENIKPIESALDKAMKLQGVTFDWKESDSLLDIKEDIGFIAQDVQKVVPELVRENDNGMLSMRHQGIAPILLEAIKELKAEIDLLKSKPCTCNKCNCNI